MAELLTVENLIALLTLTALEIVLGIDNIVFIAILVGRLPEEKRARTRQIGLWMAMGMRIALLLAIGWVMGLTKDLFTIPEFWVADYWSAVGDAIPHHGVTGRDLILMIGGLFLLGKATWEIHEKLEGEEHTAGGGSAAASVGKILIQIAILDIVFSLDSVITAVGMAKRVEIMIAAVVIAVLIMMVFAGKVSDFVDRHPTVKILALSFLILIGFMLVVEGVHVEGVHVPKGYVYFAMGFSLFVEVLNIRMRKKKKPPVKLHQRYRDDEGEGEGAAPAPAPAPAA